MTTNPVGKYTCEWRIQLWNGPIYANPHPGFLSASTPWCQWDLRFADDCANLQQKTTKTQTEAFPVFGTTWTILKSNLFCQSGPSGPFPPRAFFINFWIGFYLCFFFVCLFFFWNLFYRVDEVATETFQMNGQSKVREEFIEEHLASRRNCDIYHVKITHPMLLFWSLVQRVVLPNENLLQKKIRFSATVTTELWLVFGRAAENGVAYASHLDVVVVVAVVVVEQTDRPPPTHWSMDLRGLNADTEALLEIRWDGVCPTAFVSRQLKKCGCCAFFVGRFQKISSHPFLLFHCMFWPPDQTGELEVLEFLKDLDYASWPESSNLYVDTHKWPLTCFELYVQLTMCTSHRCSSKGKRPSRKLALKVSTILLTTLQKRTFVLQQISEKTSSWWDTLHSEGGYQKIASGSNDPKVGRDYCCTCCGESPLNQSWVEPHTGYPTLPQTYSLPAERTILENWKPHRKVWMP